MGRVTKSDKGLRFEIDGTFSFRDKEDMFRATEEIKALPQGRAVVFDLGACRFIDSAAIGMLILAAKTAEEVEASFSIVNAKGLVRELLTITKLI